MLTKTRYRDILAKNSPFSWPAKAKYKASLQAARAAGKLGVRRETITPVMKAAQLNDRTPINAGSKVSWLTRHTINKNNVYEQKLTFREKKETALSQKRLLFT